MTTNAERVRMAMLRGVSEKQWQADVIDTLHTFGWTVYHTFDSRRSAAGFPDLTAARSGDLFVAELKKMTGVVTAEQQSWLLLFEMAGVDAYIWRPSDMDDVIARARLQRTRHPYDHGQATMNGRYWPTDQTRRLLHPRPGDNPIGDNDE